MPTYEYECQECGFKSEIYCMYNPPEKRECQKCGALAVRIFSPPVIKQTGYKPEDARYGRGNG